MRKLYMGLMMLSLTALPVAASAQQPGPPPRRAFRRAMAMGMFMNPADMVLRHQAELNLTPDQLQRLGKIRDHFRDENREDLAKAQKDWNQIVTKYGEPPYSSETQEKVMHERQEMQKHYSKLWDNERKAREESMEVLSSSQRDRLMSELRMRGMGGMDMDRDHDHDRH